MKPFDEDDRSAIAADSGRFRRLQGDETVSRGDFVVDPRDRLVPWEGPSGFRADAFVNPVYRVSGKRTMARAGAKP